MKAKTAYTEGLDAGAETFRNGANGRLRQLEADLRAAHAAALACAAAAKRRHEAACERAALWVQRAAEALGRGRDDLAREALVIERVLRREGARLHQEDRATGRMAAAYAAELRAVRANMAESQRVRALCGPEGGWDATPAHPRPLWTMRPLPGGDAHGELAEAERRQREWGSLLAKNEVAVLLEELEVERALDALRSRRRGRKGSQSAHGGV